MVVLFVAAAVYRLQEQDFVRSLAGLASGGSLAGWGFGLLVSAGNSRCRGPCGLLFELLLKNDSST